MLDFQSLPNKDSTADLIKMRLAAAFGAWAPESGKKTKRHLAQLCEEGLGQPCPPQTVNGWFATGRMDKKWVPIITSILGMDLLTGTPALGRPNVIALHSEDALPEDIVQIPEYRIKFSGGNGSVAMSYELAEEMEPATYRRSWMQRMRLNPEKLKRFKVKGDSMEPLLFGGDSVLVNMAENDLKEIQDGKVYAIRYGEELRVKRLYRRLDGGLTLRSYNPEHKDEDLTPDLVTQHITVIGRVRDKSGAGGL